MRPLALLLAWLVWVAPAAAEDAYLPLAASIEASSGTPKPTQARRRREADEERSSKIAVEKRRERGKKLRLAAGKEPSQWKVRRAAWTDDDERGFEDFVRRIGESECGKVHDCLTSAEANPRFFDKHQPGMNFFADCADLPFVLRAYYAWQSGLPFSFPVRIAGHPKTPGHATKHDGFQVAERYDIVGPGPDPRRALSAISQYVSSEYFRMPPAYAGKLLNDHYPVRVDRENIKAGTVVFDPDGHLAVVFSVTEDGRINYIDAHPDNSLTRGIFNREFSRAAPPMGAGFKRWRPQTLVGAKAEPDGTLSGGQIVLTPDAELPGWSDEQFFGNVTPRPPLWSDGAFAIDGQTMDYHDYVRLRLAYPGFRYDPVADTRTMLRQLCRDIRTRVDAVNLAVKAGMPKRPQPEKLPKNIYAAGGEWEVYSTPSRDARLKTSFEELKDEVARFLKLDKEHSKVLNYAGSDLRRDLDDVYQQETAPCSVTYTKSDGAPQTLSFEEVKRRLFNLSFDPYHCVERRWGADDPQELATCRDDATKTAWYAGEARLRNQLVRTYGEPMGWKLAELQNLERDIGIKEPPDIDALRVLREWRSADTGHQ